VHVSSKNFPLYTPDSRFKGEGRESKREGGIRRNERKWEGMKDEGEGKEGGKQKEGKEDSEGWCPLNKNSGDVTERPQRIEYPIRLILLKSNRFIFI
jgi:hypothetical protein